MTADPSTAYARLRAETATMLKLDAASLSLVENLQLDLVSLLRLQVDELQGAALAGAPVDLDRLSTALAMLQKLLPSQSLVAHAPAPEGRFGPSARERLRELIERTVLREDPPEVEAERAALAAAMPPGAQYTPSAPAPFVPPPATSLQQESPPPRPLTDIEKMDRINATPALPPRGEPEPWRRHVDGSGIIAPWFNPHG